MQIVTTTDAPTPLGHYSQGIVHGNTLYISGQLPLDPVAGTVVGATIEEQAGQTLANVVAVARAGGSDRDRILKITIYLADMTLWPRLNAAYAEFFGDHRPARAVVPTRAFPGESLLEIDAIAAIN